MLVDLTEAERQILVALLFEDLSGFYEMLRDDYSSVSAAMTAYDANIVIQTLVKVDPQAAAQHRAGTLIEVEDCLG